MPHAVDAPQVMEHNIYRWAACVLGDLRELRLEHERA